jgi:hypothetical protein
VTLAHCVSFQFIFVNPSIRQGTWASARRRRIGRSAAAARTRGKNEWVTRKRGMGDQLGAYTFRHHVWYVTRPSVVTAAGGAAFSRATSAGSPTPTR